MIEPTVVVTAVTEVSDDPVCVSTQPAKVAGVASHIDATVLVTVIVVGAVAVAAFGVHVKMTFVGFVPSAPTVATCVTPMASTPCGATVTEFTVAPMRA